MKCQVDNCTNESEYVDEERQVYVCGSCHKEMLERTPDGMEVFKKIEHPEPDIIIFEENLTFEGLQRIKEEAEQYPVTATDKETYKLVYDQHQRFKRLHVAVRKKAEDLIKTAKSDFEAERDKINSDLKFVLDVIEPIRDKLETARTDYEATEKEEKERLAREEAERQQAELKRQQEEQARLEAERLAEQKRIESEQEAERKRLADEAAKVEAEKAALAYEKQKFEYHVKYGETFEILKADGTRELIDPERVQIIVKSRLDFDAAWDECMSNIVNRYACGVDEFYVVKDSEVEADSIKIAKEMKAGNRKLVSQEELDALLDDISDSPVPLDEKPEDVVTPVNFGISVDDLPISEDMKPPPMDVQPERYQKIKYEVIGTLAIIQMELEIGFESQPITDHLYNFAQVLDGFINNFPEDP